VQPVLDKYCVGCHNGQPHEGARQIPDLRAEQGLFVTLKNNDPTPRFIAGKPKSELVGKYGGVFEPSYVELRRYVRVGGFESDLRLLNPGEFHADSSELFQMLKKGHHGVELDDEAWDRLTVWIDLNTPCHGTWREVVGLERTKNDHRRRMDLRRLYGGTSEDPEVYPEMSAQVVEPIISKYAARVETKAPKVTGWPLDPAEAKRRQADAGPVSRKIDLGDGLKLELVCIPAGEFIMGDSKGYRDEQPLSRVKIAKPFWMGKFEVTNEQYARFDPSHDSKFEHKGSWIFSERHLGWLLNEPRQPVVRVSWQEAVEFCYWLSDKSGQKVSLPTEAQWEWACRAGTETPVHYGDVIDDFSDFANMADVTIRELAYDTDGRYTMDLVPREARFDDDRLVTAEIGCYQPNTWGLHDMHGNVWAVRLNYPAWQKVYNVGFRIVVESDGQTQRFASNN
jgi:formylglycine-generating enzyme required for sulfatase activity